MSGSSAPGERRESDECPVFLVIDREQESAPWPSSRKSGAARTWIVEGRSWRVSHMKHSRQRGHLLTRWLPDHRAEILIPA